MQNLEVRSGAWTKSSISSFFLSSQIQTMLSRNLPHTPLQDWLKRRKILERFSRKLTGLLWGTWCYRENIIHSKIIPHLESIIQTAVDKELVANATRTKHVIEKMVCTFFDNQNSLSDQAPVSPSHASHAPPRSIGEFESYCLLKRV